MVSTFGSDPTARVAAKVAALLGSAVSLSAEGVGIASLLFGLKGANIPLAVMGAVIVASASLVFLFFVGSRDMPSQVEGERGVRSEDDQSLGMSRQVYRIEHRKRVILVGASLLPLVLVGFLYLWAIFAGTLRPVGLVFLAETILLFGVLLAAVAFTTVQVLTDGIFRITDEGFVPRTIPLARALGGRTLIRYTEVEDAALFPDSSGYLLLVKLADGTTIPLYERTGIPRRALEGLHGRLQRESPDKSGAQGD